MSHQIHIFHTNDWHSHLDYWPRVQAYYQHEKERLIAQGDDVLFFDLGDCMDRFEPWTEAEKGKNMVQLLNELPIDAATIGNNEGIGLSHDELVHLYDDAEFPVVLSNLFDHQTHERPAFTEKYHILTLPTGIKVAVFGLTAIYPLSYDVLGWDQTAIDETITDVLTDIQNQEHPDMILFLSHLGIKEDERLAQKFSEIDVIFGSHTHHTLENGEWINDTLLTGGGKFGTYLGHLTIDYDDFLHGSRDQALSEVLLPLKDLPAVPDEAEIVASWHAKGDQKLVQSVVGEIDKALKNNETKLNPLQQYTVHAIKKETGADIALLHSGLFLTSLPKGEINRQMLHDCLPHPMRLIELEVSGEQLLNNLMPAVQTLHDDLQYQQIIGLGFRGNVFGELMFSDPITENTIVPTRMYRLVTVDHLTFLPFFSVLHQTPGKIWSDLFLRDVLGQYIHHQTVKGE